MQKIIIILIGILALTACNEDKEAIEFKKMDNLDLGNLSKENAKLKANAVFVNQSDEVLDLKDMVLDFSVDGKDIGTVVTKITKKIQPNAEFTIPFQYTYETSTFLEAGHDPSGKYTVQFKGNLTLKNSKGEEIITEIKHAAPYEYLTKKEVREENREEKKKTREEKRKERKADKND